MSFPAISTYDNYQYRSDIYSGIEDRMQNMVQNHCKVFNPRFNLEFPKNYQSDGRNKEISKLVNMTQAHLKRNGIDSHYLWVREQNGSPNPHYHISFLLDGSKINNVWAFKKIVDENWSRVLGVPVDGLQHIQNADNDYNKTMIRRPSQKATGAELEAQRQRFDDAMSDARKAARYMAKTYTKGNAPARVREFQGSQLKLED
jgi:hypothetical protein